MEEIIQALSKKTNLPKETIQKLFDYFKNSKLLWASLDQPWRYPATGDDQKSCPMLQSMFSIERRKGIIVFIPKEEIQK